MVARDGKGVCGGAAPHLPEKLNFSTVEATAAAASALMHACMHTDDVHKECMQNKPQCSALYILGPKV
jgi:hypothetical protein